VHLQDLPPDLAAEAPAARADWASALGDWAQAQLAAGATGLLEAAVPQFEQVLIRAALARTQGHRQEAAKLLGWGRNTLTRKLKDLALHEPEAPDDAADE
jgi:two-component system, NtrC family, nitrogen regulation response regulator GlnG